MSSSGVLFLCLLFRNFNNLRLFELDRHKAHEGRFREIYVLKLSGIALTDLPRYLLGIILPIRSLVGPELVLP